MNGIVGAMDVRPSRARHLREEPVFDECLRRANEQAGKRRAERGKKVFGECTYASHPNNA